MALLMRLIVVAALVNGSMGWDKKRSLVTRHAEDGKPVKQTLWSDEGMAYYGTINVGGQPQNAIYDTGSFEIVALSQCTHDEEEDHEHVKKQCCAKAKCPLAAYSPKASSKWVPDRWAETGKITYGSGPVFVRKGTEHLELRPDGVIGSNRSISDSTVPVQVVVDHEVDLFTDTQLQAIIGIGPGKFEERQDRMTHRLGIKRFMICFEEDQSKPGYITWNDKDRSDEPGWTPVPVLGKLFWATPTSAYKLVNADGSSTAVGCQNGCGAIIDTGTSLISPPKEVITAISKQIELNQIEDCSDLSKFPTLSFKLGDQEFTLPPQAYIGDAGENEAGLKQTNLAFPLLPMHPEGVNLIKMARKHGKAPPKVKSCALLLSEGDPSESTPWGPMVIFGMALFRKYAVQFDLAGDLEGITPTFEQPTRIMRLAEASSDCKGHKKGGMQFKQRTFSAMQKVNLNKVRVSPMQQRFQNQGRRLKGLLNMRQKQQNEEKVQI